MVWEDGGGNPASYPIAAAPAGDGDGGIGDGEVSMADFRLWRKVLLQVEDDARLDLDD